MIDVRNRELAEVSKADDFVVSNKLVSLMLAQAAENEYMTRIFGSLLDEHGSELYLKPATDYVESGAEVDFYTITVAAMLQGQTAIGYRKRNGGGWSVRINPAKSERIRFEAGEQVVVLSAS